MGSFIQYSQALYWYETGEYVDAYYQFLQMGDYEDSLALAQDILKNRKASLYEEAVRNYEKMSSGSFESALHLFSLIPEYEDSAQYIRLIEFMDKMCGTYTKTGILDNDSTFIIEYGKVTRYDDDGYCTTSTMSVAEIDGRLCYITDSPIPIRTLFTYNDNLPPYRVYWRYSTQGYETKFEAMRTKSNGTELLSEPKIGMTSDEILKSTWGEPKKINKTTYSWGIAEQWVYSNYRYIYFENGIVTAIQEY